MNILTPTPDNPKDLLKQINYLAEIVEEHIENAKDFQDVDQRALAVARQELQTGFMWLRRGLENPTEF